MRPQGGCGCCALIEGIASAPNDARTVDAVSGCLMLIARRVFERIGALDERYFFGFEDLDVCLRARAAGITTVVSPARAYHGRAQSLPARAPRTSLLRRAQPPAFWPPPRTAEAAQACGGWA